MKNIIILLSFVGTLAHSQQLPDCMECCEQSFPYLFCPSGEFHCSINPANDPNGIPFRMLQIPGCIEFVGEFPDHALIQPTDIDKHMTPPDPDDPFFQSEEEYQAALDQWELDNTRFEDDPFHEFQPVDPLAPNPNNYPGGAQGRIYKAAKRQYEKDLALYNDAINDYVIVWDQEQAEEDAQAALDLWSSICPQYPKNEECCLKIVFSSNSNDFITKNYLNALGEADPAKCGEGVCPERVIRINITDLFLYQNNDPRDAVPNYGYRFNPVPYASFFTGQSPPTVYQGYKTFSFYQLVQHEIGHFLGLLHPELELPPNSGNSAPCPNNVTEPCDPPRKMVMFQGSNKENQVPIELQEDDNCMFKKVYCNPCTSSVFDGGYPSLNALIRPNPSKNVAALSYSLFKQEKVTVAIYDQLGRKLLTVLSEVQNPGDFTIPIGLEVFPSGIYICQIQVGIYEEKLTFIVAK